jgi:outer membrane protein OmpA-like peptidoglycan-associated protein
MQRQLPVLSDKEKLMKTLTKIKVLLTAAAISINVSAASAVGDVKGSKDNPLIKRYEGSSILYYDKKAYAEFKFLLGPVARDLQREEPKTRTLEGAYTRLGYLIPEGHSPLEILRNYQDELKSKGGKVLFECKDKECGNGNIGNYIYPSSKIPGGSTGSIGGCLIAPDSSDHISDQRYAVLEIPGTGAFVSVFSYNITNTIFTSQCGSLVGRTAVVVDIVEPKAREQKMVAVQASDMASAISSTGKIALYGIYFDTNKADVKPESDGTLEQMTKLLKDSSSLRLLVVGHTDNVGGFTANMDLSQRRAASVASKLIGKYGIGKDRLLPVGVSFASPITTNASEEGRAKNRRVELVENSPLNR